MALLPKPRTLMPLPQPPRHASGARRVQASEAGRPQQDRRPAADMRRASPSAGDISLGTGEFEVLLDSADIARDPYQDDDDDDFHTAAFSRKNLAAFQSNRAEGRPASHPSSPRRSAPPPARYAPPVAEARPAFIPRSVPAPYIDFEAIADGSDETPLVEDRDATRVGPVPTPTPSRSFAGSVLSSGQLAALSSRPSGSGPALGYPLPVTPAQGVRAHVSYVPPMGLQECPRIPTFNEVLHSAQFEASRGGKRAGRRAEKRSHFAFVLGLAAGMAMIGVAFGLLATNQIPVPAFLAPPKAPRAHVTAPQSPIAQASAAQVRDAQSAAASPAAKSGVSAPLAAAVAPVSPTVSNFGPTSPSISSLGSSPGRTTPPAAPTVAVSAGKKMQDASKLESKTASSAKPEPPKAEAKAKAVPHAEPRVHAAAAPPAVSAAPPAKSPTKLSASELSDAL